MKVETNVKLKPAQMAELIWDMWDDEQAEMLHHLLVIAGSEHNLMMQFLQVRDRCEKRESKDSNDKSLAAFQSMFASGFKYFGAQS